MTTEDFLRLRNKVHFREARFDLEPIIWESQYLSGPDGGKNEIIQIERQGRLEGFAICGLSKENDVNMYNIYEICAISEAVFEQLLDLVDRSANEKGADIINAVICMEPYDRIFDRKNYANFGEPVAMIALLDPKILLNSLSNEIVKGRTLGLKIKGFDPITIIVGEDKIAVTGYRNKQDVTISMNSDVFLRLFFGRTTFLREVLKGRVSVKGWLYSGTALKFFQIIKQRKWYIPNGDVL